MDSANHANAQQAITPPSKLFIFALQKNQNASVQSEGQVIQSHPAILYLSARINQAFGKILQGLPQSLDAMAQSILKSCRKIVNFL